MQPNYEVLLNQADISEGQVLEGTGSLVFDHSNSIVYLCESQRASLQAFDMFLDPFMQVQAPFRAVTFKAVDKLNKPIYHTNCMIADLDRHLICCLESIKEDYNRELIRQVCLETGKQLVTIDYAEMENFCGNVI